MHRPTAMIGLLTAWVMAIIHYQIEMNTGLELNVLLYAAMAIGAISIYLACRNEKVTYKEEA